MTPRSSTTHHQKDTDENYFQAVEVQHHPRLTSTGEGAAGPGQALDTSEVRIYPPGCEKPGYLPVSHVSWHLTCLELQSQPWALGSAPKSSVSARVRLRAAPRLPPSLEVLSGAPRVSTDGPIGPSDFQEQELLSC